MKQFDAIIIGFGKGGKTLAAEMAKRGMKTAMVEKSPAMYGGTCINIGCIPTKALVHLAKHAPRNAGPEEKKRYYAEAISKKDAVTGMLREKNYRNLADNPNVTVFTGEGRFTGPDSIEVELATGGREELKAPRIFINTGAETIMPHIEGIEDNPSVFTSTTIMELTELPDKLLIIGGGYIGLEFASIYASFGSHVTVLEGHTELIPREDRDIASAVKETLEKKGITFKMNAKVLSVNGNEVFYEDASEGSRHSITSDAILLATGRRPATEGLGLAAAGVVTDERGAIITDSRLVTSNPAIRAIGDVKGGPQFTYISLDDYRIIREDLFGNKGRSVTDRDPVSYSVFIDPPLSRIGMSEEEALKKGYDIKVGRLPVAAIPRARTLGETDGLFKAVTDAGTGKILGCTLFGPESGEVINSVTIAMKAGADYKFLRDFIFTHPSMSESLNDLMNI